MLGEKRFGTGLTWPVQRSGQGSYVEASGLDLLDSDIRLLIGIQQGELRWDPNRGTRLRRIQHRRLRRDMLDAIATNEIAGAIRRSEPRARPGSASGEQVDDKLKLYAEYIPLGYDRGGQGTSTAATEIG